MRKSMIYLLAVTYALIIGFSFLFTKMALNVSNPIDMLAYRFTISFLVILILVMARWIKLGMRGKDFWRLLPIGLIYPTMFFGFQAFGLMDQTSSEGGIFQASAPIMTMVLAAIFLEGKNDLAAKACCSLFRIRDHLHSLHEGSYSRWF
jgi:drug/metabolite transporter (DMT)-like permease